MECDIRGPSFDGQFESQLLLGVSRNCQFRSIGNSDGARPNRSAALALNSDAGGSAALALNSDEGGSAALALNSDEGGSSALALNSDEGGSSGEITSARREGKVKFTNDEETVLPFPRVQ